MTASFKPFFSFTATNPLDFKIVNKILYMNNLHANLLCQLEIDPEALTFRHQGYVCRLTDVHETIACDLST